MAAPDHDHIKGLLKLAHGSRLSRKGRRAILTDSFLETAIQLLSKHARFSLADAETGEDLAQEVFHCRLTGDLT
jgi:hypothetical protein